jgi:hypothetical protein
VGSTGAERGALYPRLCGAAWRDVDVLVRRFHEAHRPLVVRGTFDLTSGPGFLRAVAWLMGLPRPGVGVKTSLEIQRHEGGEIWRRRFGDEPFVTDQRSSDDRLLLERTRFGELTFRLAVEEGALCLEQVAAAFRLGSLTLPLPRWLAPSVRAREFRDPDQSGQLRVEVDVSLPLLGRVFDYRGVLDLEPGAS